MIIFFVLILAIGAYLKSPKVRGAKGESKVSTRLSLFLPSGSYEVFNDVTLPTARSSTQIDHIVISPFGVFVIETKNYSGWIFGSADARHWTQVLYKKKHRLFNPLWQNAHHVKAVRRFLALPDRYVFSVIVFVGNAKIKTKKKLPSNVVYLRQLRSFIRSKSERILSAHEINSASRKLRYHQKSVTAEERAPHVSVVNVEPECPQCSAKMVKRTATRGKYAGKEFWGCTNYPSCKGIRNI
ncbi:NERD domain-containing protein [Lentisalinibacter salinarum]|uniref:NERD domain-containing protein n=1 Tax=Lentisalinibacter salinarum TaxID=2992239 RepID=UPI00386EDDEE